MQKQPKLIADDVFVFTGDSQPIGFFHFAPLADVSELEPITNAAKIKSLALQHDMRVSGTDKKIETDFQLICSFFTRCFDEKDKIKTRLVPLKEVQELLSIFSTYHMPKGHRAAIGNNYGANIITLAALYADMNTNEGFISLPSVLSGRVANWMIAASHYPDSAWSQLRPRQPDKKKRTPIAQPSIIQKDEQDEVKTQYRRLKDELEAFNAMPEKDRHDLETGYMRFTVLPRLAELEALL